MVITKRSSGKFGVYYATDEFCPACDAVGEMTLLEYSVAGEVLRCRVCEYVSQWRPILHDDVCKGFENPNHVRRGLTASVSVLDAKEAKTGEEMETLTLAELALSKIAFPIAYSEWVKCGFALAQAFGAKTAARLMFKYSPPSYPHETLADYELKFAKANGTVNIGTLFEIAKRHGFTFPKYPHPDSHATLSDSHAQKLLDVLIKFKGQAKRRTLLQYTHFDKPTFEHALTTLIQNGIATITTTPNPRNRPITYITLLTHSVTTQNQSVANESQSVASVAQSVATQSQSVATDVQSVANQSQSVATQSQSVATDVQSVASESQSVATDVQSVATDVQSVATDVQSVATQSQSVANKSQSVATQSQSVASESQSVANKSQSVASESQSVATEIQSVAMESEDELVEEVLDELKREWVNRVMTARVIRGVLTRVCGERADKVGRKIFPAHVVRLGTTDQFTFRDNDLRPLHLKGLCDVNGNGVLPTDSEPF